MPQLYLALRTPEQTSEEAKIITIKHVSSAKIEDVFSLYEKCVLHPDYVKLGLTIFPEGFLCEAVADSEIEVSGIIPVLH